MSAELVLLHHNEPMTTSLAIAEGTENTHESVIKLVRKYVEDLQEFGTFGFEIQKSGGRPTEIAYLNEPQATLLITYLRNTETVRRFKIALVKAFYEMRGRLLSGAGQQQFVTGNVSHGADLAAAADRTFRSFLRAARSAGLRLPQALRQANAKTIERTGMDMLAELDVDPDAPPPADPVRPPEPTFSDPIRDAIMAWAEGAEPGRFYTMVEILREACGVKRNDDAFQRMAPRAGYFLRRLGFINRKARRGGAPTNFWIKH